MDNDGFDLDECVEEEKHVDWDVNTLNNYTTNEDSRNTYTNHNHNLSPSRNTNHNPTANSAANEPISDRVLSNISPDSTLSVSADSVLPAGSLSTVIPHSSGSHLVEGTNHDSSVSRDSFVPSVSSNSKLNISAILKDLPSRPVVYESDEKKSIVNTSSVNNSTLEKSVSLTPVGTWCKEYIHVCG